MNYFRVLFIFFILLAPFCRAESSWEDSWGGLDETESIDSGDIDTGDIDTGDVSGEEDAGGKKAPIEESARMRTKEALKGFLEDAIDGYE